MLPACLWYDFTMRSGVDNTKMVNSKYSMAFTTCSLLNSESVTVAELFLKKKDWKEVSKIATEENILQYRTVSSLKRTLSEIVSRLKLLSDDAINLLVNGYREEQLQILWLAVCLRYPFIYEFSIEVIREKYRCMQYKIEQFDFDAFFNSKINYHESLEEITETTRKKLKQVLFKMMKESEIVDKDDNVQAALLSDRVINVISNMKHEYLMVYPN